VTDDELQARLRAADPASSLPPADPSRVARLLEDTMSDDPSTESRASGSRATAPTTGTRGRGPLTWLAAAAAVLLIVGGGAFAVTGLGLGGGSGTSGAGNDTPVRADDKPTLTELSAPSARAYAARCMVPSARTIASQEVAFEGTVDDIADGVVTLTPTHWYHGPETGMVLIEAPAPQLADLIGAARFEVGQRYLVSATGRVVTVCGLTAPYSTDLAALYAEAFPG
jgi:hypothetical protein